MEKSARPYSVRQCPKMVWPNLLPKYCRSTRPASSFERVYDNFVIVQRSQFRQCVFKNITLSVGDPVRVAAEFYGDKWAVIWVAHGVFVAAVGCEDKIVVRPDCLGAVLDSKSSIDHWAGAIVRDPDAHDFVVFCIGNHGKQFKFYAS